MTPEIDRNILTLEIVEQPSLTYKLDLQSGRIGGMTDGKDAILQMIQKSLSTEKYTFAIYNRDYGVQLQPLIGQASDYILADIKRVVREALLVDDRVLSITDFKSYVIDTNTVEVSFQVNSTVGSVTYSTEVDIL